MKIRSDIFDRDRSRSIAEEIRPDKNSNFPFTKKSMPLTETNILSFPPPPLPPPIWHNSPRDKSALDQPGWAAEGRNAGNNSRRKLRGEIYGRRAF